MKSDQGEDGAAAPECLSGILQELSFSGVLCCSGHFAEPWGICGPDGDYPLFHYIREGRCTLQLQGENYELSQGDLVVLPHGHGHTLHDGTGEFILPLKALLPSVQEAGAHRIEIGQGPHQMRSICGLFFIEKQIEIPFWTALPPLLHLRHRELTQNAWLPAMLDSLFIEADLQTPAAGLIANRMSELVFLMALRHALTHHTTPSSGWLYALQEPQLSRALWLIHTRYQESWTLEQLAKATGMSRTQFATTFKKHTTKSPIAYLTETRMRHAARMLREDKFALKKIAEMVGFHSIVGFHNAFKRAYDLPPGAFRARFDAQTTPTIVEIALA